MAFHTIDMSWYRIHLLEDSVMYLYKIKGRGVGQMITLDYGGRERVWEVLKYDNRIHEQTLTLIHIPG